jgi:hypothetical protein
MRSLETLQLRLGGLSILFRSRDLPIRDWVAPYEPFLADGGDGHDILADLELVLRGSGRRVAAAEQERLLAHVREYLEQAVRPSPVQERVIQLRLKAVSDLLSSPAFVECLQDFDPVGGQWRSLKVGGPHVWFVDGDVRRGRFFFSA